MITVDNNRVPFDPGNPSLSTIKGDTDFASQLQSALKTKDGKKLYQSCQDMEAVFLSKVMEVMRSSIPKSGFLDEGFANDTFQSMLYDEYAKSMSKTNSLGISQILFRQLSQQL
ncbi:MAG TPA: rod-binding protein [Syntrophomonadaceae bacterium]|nr:rod-binding protein [Syntrophomonadaceae bacterium]